ncbi:MAG: ATPase, T2SS/T4P/T4SS family [Bacilli bacterium]
MAVNPFVDLDYGPLQKYLDDPNITDISYSNNGQLWLKTLDKGVIKAPTQNVTNVIVEKLAFQCANAMGKNFNMANPLLDSEAEELRMNFIHESVAANGIAVLIRKTPALIRLKDDKMLEENYIPQNILDLIIQCVHGHCNIMVSGETGSGKTEVVKFLASKTIETEKLITIEDTLELHLHKIYPHRDIVAMKTNIIVSYSDVLVACMRQNPKWILLSEVRSAEAVTAVRNSVSSGHYILSTIHSDRASNIPMRLYSLLEGTTNIDQFLTSIHRYIQLGIHVRAVTDPKTGRFYREICEVTEFYVDEDNKPGMNHIFLKNPDGSTIYNSISKYLIRYLGSQGITVVKHNVIDDKKRRADSELLSERTVEILD